MKRALILLLFLSACWTANPGPAAFTDAQAPVGLTARAVSGQVAWIQVAVRAGSAHDPVGREGLASLTALALREGGAGERSPDEVEQALYALGTDVEVVVDRELVTYRTRALVEDLDVIAGLLGDMLLAPVFDEAAVERIRGEAADRLDRALVARDEQLGHEVFDTWIFEGHPYGHPADGRAGVVETLELAEVRQFRAARYVRPAIHLGVAGPMVTDAGDIDGALQGGAAITTLRDRLSERPADLYEDVTPRAVPPVEGRTLLVVQKGTDATGVHMGHPTTLHRGHPDWPAMLLAATAFGEHRQSHGRLYRTLRGARGLNYGDYAYLEMYRQAGWSPPQETGTGRLQNPFYIWLRPVSAANGPFAVKAALGLFEDFVEDGLEPEEFERIRTYLEGRIALWAPGPERRLGWALEANAMGWPDPVDTLPAQVASLELDEVNAAIARHLDPAHLKIVVVTGEAEAFAEALTGEAPTSISYDAEPPDADSEQSLQDSAWAEADAAITGWHVVQAEGIFR